MFYLKENIYFGYDGDDPEAILLHGAAEHSQLMRDCDMLHDGFDTIVGEKGITLSGGQRQRAAISRALIGNHVIYIFDDSFSSVDHETEEMILSDLRKHLKGKTCIFISHRISTLKRCDKVLVLKHGKIHELGTHAELIENKQEYYRTVALQNLEGAEI